MHNPWAKYEPKMEILLSRRLGSPPKDVSPEFIDSSFEKLKQWSAVNSEHIETIEQWIKLLLVEVGKLRAEYLSSETDYLDLDYTEAMKLYNSGSRLFHPSRGVWLELVREGEDISLRSADVDAAMRLF